MSTQLLGSNYTRRGIIRKLAGGAAVVALAGVVVGGGLPNAVSADGVSAYFRTTSALNLRSQPTTTSSVILVIPYNALVTAVGEDKNGFTKVSYSGNVGWAHRDFLTISNGGSNDTPVYTGNGYTNDDVNMRSGAGISYSVLRVLPAGTTIGLYDAYSNNYRLIRHNGQFGWVHVDFINPGGSGQQPGYLVTTANLNLRSGPDFGASILKVIPLGAQVAAGDQFANGFRAVTYAGVSGWASTTYLK